MTHESYGRGGMHDGKESHGEKRKGVAEKTVLDRGEGKDGGGEGSLNPCARALYRGALRNEGGGDPAMHER